MAERAELSAHARESAELLRETFGGEVSDHFLQSFVFEGLHLGSTDLEDFGALVFLECHELVFHGQAISEQSLKRILHRIRQRMVRRARRELHLDPSQLAELAARAPQPNSATVSEGTIQRLIRVFG